jgi:signal transduction histidine kinase
MDELQKLREENEQLRKMNALKSDWISISAHQLRTSLSAIKWILKMFLDKDFGELNVEQQGFMRKAFDSTERLVALVNEMLSLNHAQETLSYSFSKTDLVPLIDDVVFDFHGESFKKHVGVVFLKPPTEIPEIESDTEKIRVVLQNLIENAIKYSVENDSVIISIEPRETEVTIAVKDTGIGIPKEQQPQIFEKFYRASNAKEKESIGSGLGLFTTKSIVEAHHGRIWFESDGKTGTTFYVALPYKQEARKS